MQDEPMVQIPRRTAVCAARQILMAYESMVTHRPVEFFDPCYTCSDGIECMENKRTAFKILQPLLDVAGEQFFMFRPDYERCPCELFISLEDFKEFEVAIQERPDLDFDKWVNEKYGPNAPRCIGFAEGISFSKVSLRPYEPPQKSNKLPVPTRLFPDVHP